ncbi:MAG: hypothetical protein GEV07_09675 [Streptosporangiales bacterium]|nr:hypothetical protein [Streptosporangiales bacterium]
MADEPTVTRLAQLVEQVEREVTTLEQRVAALPRRTWVWWVVLATTVFAGLTLLLPWARFGGGELAAVAFGLHTEHTLAFRVLYLVTVVVVAIALSGLSSGVVTCWLVTAAGGALAGATGWTWIQLAGADVDGVAGVDVGLYAALAASCLLAAAGFAGAKVGLWTSRAP